MEWVLQAVDEVDDAVGVLRLYALGLNAEIGLVVASSVAASAVCAALLQVSG